MIPAHQPLAGITVIEIGSSVAAPFAGPLLGELGAEVIKVENPAGGDDARRWGPPFWHDASATYQCLNREKFGITVDFRDPTQLERLRRLIVERADVVVQNLRPGIVERNGIDAATLRPLAPRLVYCNMGAFGRSGPLRERPGYDPMMQAFAGIMSITGEEGRPPVRVGPSIVDIGTAFWAVIGVIAALRRRELTGAGCEVDTSLYEAALAWMTVPAALYASVGHRQGRTGSEAAIAVPYKAFRAGDGYLIIAAGNDDHFERLCRVLDRAEWIDDARFRTNADRLANRAAVNTAIEAVIGEQPRSHWLDALDRAGVPCAPLQSIDEVFEHPQTQALGMLQRSPDERFTMMGPALAFDGVRPPFRRTPPRLGEHNRAVFGAPDEEAARDAD
ncbi:MAG: CoA transferase [Burkholderiales bacterium]|nr:MAG: CoA transferase [Burkholderiales bacterium]